ncbi:MAG TPA: hypothetical protein VLE89_04880 [Chlamydiales bacterium]|nr:hypothetical protein [Chlamydiales bacterium]
MSVIPAALLPDNSGFLNPRPPADWQQIGHFFNSLDDCDLRMKLQEISGDYLIPDRWQKKEWFAHFPFRRVLEICDADQMRYILTFLTRGYIDDWQVSVLDGAETSLKINSVLNVLINPHRLSVFIQALKQGRSDKNGRGGLCIHIGPAELLAHDADPNSLFHNALPANVKTLLEIENSSDSEALRDEALDNFLKTANDEFFETLKRINDPPSKKCTIS